MPIDSPGIAHAYLASRRDRGRSPSRPRALAYARFPGWSLRLIALALLLCAAIALAEEPAGEEFRGLDTEVQALTQEVVDLNRDLFILEEELLFPANTQVAVFVSMDTGTFFALDSVLLVVDGKEVSNYLYTQREVDALQRGGVHRVWLGNLKAGTHEVTAFLTGQGPHARDYERGTTLEIEKGVGPKYVELKISDRVQKLQPEFVVKEWE